KAGRYRELLLMRQGGTLAHRLRIEGEAGVTIDGTIEVTNWQAVYQSGQQVPGVYKVSIPAPAVGASVVEFERQSRILWPQQIFVSPRTETDLSKLEPLWLVGWPSKPFMDANPYLDPR